MTAVIGTEFARALAAKDGERLRSLLADAVDFQGLTPGRHWTAATAVAAVNDVILGHWFGPGDDITSLRSVAAGQVADRERVAYRLAVDRNGDHFVVEQQAYYESDGEHITWMRVLCSGYRPDLPVDALV